mmetsp:Transcript_25692/g.67418  ORF Transcript_25692/g.67418 Transcript_25692/m.67418 type:complete len:177 (+) Transcript_25692:322-852(+)
MPSRWSIMILGWVAAMDMTHAMSFAHGMSESDQLSADLYIAKAGDNPKNAPAAFNPMVLVAGGLFALTALFLALASQRQQRAQRHTQALGHGTRTAWSTAMSKSPTTTRKVRWQLGTAASEGHDDNDSGTSMYIAHSNKGVGGHKKNAPSYDGMYWNAGHEDDPPSPYCTAPSRHW